MLLFEPGEASNDLMNSSSSAAAIFFEDERPRIERSFGHYFGPKVCPARLYGGQIGKVLQCIDITRITLSKRRTLGNSEWRIAPKVREPPCTYQPPALDGNSCIERTIWALKGELLWVQNFEPVEEPRLALLIWSELYNQQLLIQRDGFKYPVQ